MDTDPGFVRLLEACTARMESGEELSGTEIAQILTTLTEREVAEGGPYRNAEDDAIDIGLNIVVARFLQALDIRLSALDAYIEEALQEGASSDILDSSALSEEISRYRVFLSKGTQCPVSYTPHTDTETAILEAVRAAMHRRLRNANPEIHEGATHVIERTIEGNPDKQMTLMAAYVRQALGKKGNVFTDVFLGELGFANACFWSSFIVYDDFWDEDEAAEPGLLPVANLLARTYIRYFTELLPEDTGFTDYSHRMMDRLDAANAWETRSCRMRVEGNRIHLPEALPAYGDFDIKFYPAAGHVMGPVAMFCLAGHAVNSPETTALVVFFENYLIAMQLNDDMHDWQEDLRRGHISTAVSVLLDAWTKAHPERREIDLVEDMPELQHMFWFTVLDCLCESVLARTKRSREALSQLTFLEDMTPLSSFIDRNEAIANAALRERAKSDAFLTAFTETSAEKV